MGFKRKKPTIVNMTFDGEYEGLEINMRVPSINQYVELLKASGKMHEIDKMNEEDVVPSLLEEAILDMAKILYKLSDSWNMTDDDETPIPLTVQAFGDEEIPFLMSVSDALGRAMSSVNPELGKDSTSGETSLMSLTTEVL